MQAALPAGYTLRRPIIDDLQAVADMIRACDIAESGTSDFTTSELRNYWNHPGFDLANDAWVALAPSDEIVGYEEYQGDGDDTHHQLDGYVHPEHSGLGIGTHLLRVAEMRAREDVARLLPGTAVLLRANINAANKGAHALFQSEGYTSVRHFWRMQIQLDSPPTPPEWPAGMSVRTFVQGQDERVTYAAIEEAFADHWGHVPVPFEEWTHARLGREGFDPTLWFLALDGDKVAGVALGFPRGDDGGWVQGLGVRRPWRRAGLGMALLRHAFNAFHERGKSWVGLAVDAASPTGASRLYERAGMQVVEQYATYEKTL